MPAMLRARAIGASRVRGFASRRVFVSCLNRLNNQCVAASVGQTGGGRTKRMKIAAARPIFTRYESKRGGFGDEIDGLKRFKKRFYREPFVRQVRHWGSSIPR
ncbi:hypothetical protein [Burkholderia territorii]|uniref:hypothetical protein n=1 Tax=Burkholderia territorii TaxID=1503055 RepID=UPI0012D8AACB|nr:hypothetical protein [Burkholderia territorii]